MEDEVRFRRGLDPGQQGLAAAPRLPGFAIKGQRTYTREDLTIRSNVKGIMIRRTSAFSHGGELAVFDFTTPFLRFNRAKHISFYSPRLIFVYVERDIVATVPGCTHVEIIGDGERDIVLEARGANPAVNKNGNQLPAPEQERSTPLGLPTGLLIGTQVVIGPEYVPPDYSGVLSRVVVINTTTLVGNVRANVQQRLLTRHPLTSIIRADVSLTLGVNLITWTTDPVWSREHVELVLTGGGAQVQVAEGFRIWGPYESVCSPNADLARGDTPYLYFATDARSVFDTSL